MPANHLINHVITILIRSAKTHFQNIFVRLRCKGRDVAVDFMA